MANYISNMTVDKVNYELKDNGARNDIGTINLALANKANSADLASIATSGDFSDLQNKPTTLAGYGITDAASTEDAQKAATAVQSVKITGSSTELKNGTNVVLPAYPTSLPASDVKAWAKEDNKPTYTASEVGALSDTVTHLSGDVPTTRTVNGKALSVDITLTAADVNALPNTTVIPTISDSYSSTSSDGMSGKAVASAISGKADSSDIPTAATVEGWGFSKTTGTYSKPTTGIPKSDLANDVQTSLGKADTAIQSLSGYATEQYVNDAIDALAEPMVFKGSLGVDGTINTLPAAAKSNEGFTYKVITEGTYASQAAKVGDVFISNGTTWTLIPSGDEPSGTVTSVGVSVPTGLSVSDSPITSSGTIAITYESGYSIPTTSKQSDWDAKQAALTTDQLAAANSGITATKVSTYDGYASQISGKYTKPSTGIPASDLAAGVIPTSLPASNVTDVYSSTGTAPVNGKAVASAISTKQDALNFNTAYNATTNKVATMADITATNLGIRVEGTTLIIG